MKYFHLLCDFSLNEIPIEITLHTMKVENTTNGFVMFMVHLLGLCEMFNLM